MVKQKLNRRELAKLAFLFPWIQMLCWIYLEPGFKMENYSTLISQEAQNNISQRCFKLIGCLNRTTESFVAHVGRF